MSYVEINGWAWLDEEWIKTEDVDHPTFRRQYLYVTKHGFFHTSTAWLFQPADGGSRTYKAQGQKFTSEEKLESFMSTTWRWKKG